MNIQKVYGFDLDYKDVDCDDWCIRNYPDAYFYYYNRQDQYIESLSQAASFEDVVVFLFGRREN